MYQENLSGMTGKINPEYKSTPDSNVLSVSKAWDGKIN
jgi:hypothetical protein